MSIPISLPVQEVNKNVLILSKTFKLTHAQFTLLNRGLTFIPTKGINSKIREQTTWDLQQYHRRVKLAAYFRNTKNKQPPPLTPQSDWTPLDGSLPPVIMQLIQADRDHFHKNFKIHRTKPNLNPEEVKALKELKNNKSIVIKPADKGSAVVIMDREQYLWEGYRQLNDKTYYHKLDRPIYLDTMKLVEKITNSLLDKKFINSQQNGVSHLKSLRGDRLCQTVTVRRTIQQNS